MNVPTAAPAAEPQKNGAHPAEAPATVGLGPQTSAVLEATEEARRWQLEPTDFDSTWRMAEIVFKTKLCGVTSVEDAFVRLMTGRALGLSTMASLRGIYVIDGKPALDSKTKVALAMRHPACLYFELVESTNEKAVYKTKRRGQDQRLLTFEISDAKRAGLIKDKSNWEKWPAPMCRARAASQLVDIVYPDATNGLSSIDDLEDARIANIENAVDLRPPPQAAPTRDFVAEAAALKERIAKATPETRKEMVNDLRAFVADAPPEIAQDVRNFYGMVNGSKLGATTPTETPNQPATPAPPPSGNQPANDAGGQP